ncbi:MAG: ferrous iron transport protein A [Oscillospiraceae bacterium]|nr:ferrous iron transport protein A [Oscillospiraceae bacterium]
MPLTFANIGEQNTIKKVGGGRDIKIHLENLGFAVGADVTVISKILGNVIVNVKETRVAISEEMAKKILI